MIECEEYDIGDLVIVPGYMGISGKQCGIVIDKKPLTNHKDDIELFNVVFLQIDQREIELKDYEMEKA